MLLTPNHLCIYIGLVAALDKPKFITQIPFSGKMNYDIVDGFTRSSRQ